MAREHKEDRGDVGLMVSLNNEDCCGMHAVSTRQTYLYGENCHRLCRRNNRRDRERLIPQLLGGPVIINNVLVSTHFLAVYIFL